MNVSAGGTEVRESLNQYAATPLDLSSIPGSLTDSSGAPELENALGPEILDGFELDPAANRARSFAPKVCV